MRTGHGLKGHSREFNPQINVGVPPPLICLHASLPFPLCSAGANSAIVGRGERKANRGQNIDTASLSGVALCVAGSASDRTRRATGHSALDWLLHSHCLCTGESPHTDPC